MKNYRSLNEKFTNSKSYYKNLLNEQRVPYGKDGAGKFEMPGIPGQCCDGGPNCIPVTFSSAADDCSTLGYDECNHPQ